MLSRRPRHPHLPYTTLFRSHVRRIEQHQRVPAPADLDGVLHRGAARHGMEDADRLPFAELLAHGPHHALEIAGELAVMMVRSEEHTSELQSPCNLVCQLMPE